MNIQYINGDVLITTPDFCLADTLDCGQAFRFYKDNGCWFGIVGRRMIKMSQDGDCITLHQMTQDEFERDFYSYFTLERDYGMIKSVLQKDERLRTAIDCCGGIRLLLQQPWETLCSFIFSQNCNIPRIKGMISRLCESLGEPIDGGYTFPDAQRVAAAAPEQLEVVRAGFRTKYIVDAAVKVATGEVLLEFDDMTTEQAANELMKIKGVGEKVAACTLLFSAGRIDAFPQDVWVKRIMATLYPDGMPDFVLPYRGIAQQYLFHYARLHPMEFCIK